MPSMHFYPGILPVSAVLILVAGLCVALNRFIVVENRRAQESLARMMLLQPILPDSFIDPLLVKYPHSADLHATWCWAETRNGYDSPEAERRVTAFRKRFPRDGMAIFQWCKLLSAQGRYAEADKILAGAKDSLYTRKYRRDLYEAHALNAQASGDYDEALRRWRVVQKNFPGNLSSYVSQASILLRNADYPSLHAVLTKALVEYSDNESLLRLRAELAMAQSDWAGAEQCWRKYRHHYDSRIEGYLRGAEASFRSGNPAAALNLLESVEMLFNRDETAVAGRLKLLAQYAAFMKEPLSPPMS